MKIVFFTPYPSEGASTRYRIEQFIPFLEREGYDCHVKPFINSRYYKIVYKKGFLFHKMFYFILMSIKRFIDLVSCMTCDVVFVHRQIYPFGGVFFEKMLKHLMRKPIIYDFDDAIYLSVTTPNNRWIGTLKNNYNKVKEIVKLSDIVLAGNNYLRDFALQFNKNVVVVPTVVDIENYRSKVHIEKPVDEIVIGWIGSEGTTGYLEQLKPVMNKLVKAYNVRFRLIGADINQFKNMQDVEVVNWSQEKELDLLYSFDIGINPLTLDDFTLGKCGLKTIQYMAMGIPCVSSPVGVNNKIILHGINGYLAGNEQEWFKCIEKLILDVNIRKDFGKSARNEILQKYTVQVWKEELIDILKRFER